LARYSISCLRKRSNAQIEEKAIADSNDSAAMTPFNTGGLIEENREKIKIIILIISSITPSIPNPLFPIATVAINYINSVNRKGIA